MSEHWRPRFHLHPSYGFVNDPNGPVLVDGWWHLYFQYRPNPTGDAPVEWGHASSADGVRWRFHRAALTPIDGALDDQGCWSGNTVIDTDGRLGAPGRVVAFYSGSRSGHPYQSVLRAISDDGGLSFGDPEPVVADPAPEERILEYRDPFVWRDGDRWRMVVGACTVDAVAMVRGYVSDDLTTWHNTGALRSLERTTLDGIDTGWMWECPQVIGGGEEALTVVSTMISGGPDPGAGIGEWGFGQVVAIRTPITDDGSGASDVPLDPRLVDHGSNLYAASVMRDSPAGTLLWGWVTESRPRSSCVATGWSGLLSVPRVVTVEDGVLRQQPLPALEGLRGPALEPSDAPDAPAGAIRYAEVPGAVELRVTPTDARSRTVLDLGADERVEVIIDREAGEILLDRAASGGVPLSGPGTMTLVDPDLGPSRPYGVTLLVDGSVIELFTSTGRALTTRVYPSQAPPWSATVAGADVEGWPLTAE